MVTAFVLALALSAAHPLHSTIADVSTNNGAVRATIRVFADDFGTAVTRSLRGRSAPAGPAWDAAAVAYVASTFALSDRAGRALALRSCGVRRAADMYFVCVETTVPAKLEALRVGNRILCDVWDDQVNVVQATIGGARRSLLFTKGDGAKPL